ncbi:MAG: ribonuclease J, partial [Cyanobium sp. MAG06]|nr:ribonuclease J [Cyanobium sp. MAG06]
RELKNFSVFKDMNTLLLMTDSTNCENPGFSISDKLVFENIENTIKNVTGRLLIASFASQVERMIFMLQTAEKYNKKIVIDGRSMKNNIEIIKIAELLKLGENTIIPLEDIDKIPPNKLIIMVTGAQGEEFAALSRIANKSHKFIKLNKYDTVLMSSSVIPGNELSVQRLKDNLAKQGAHLLHYRTSDVHSSGHANADELA